MRVTAQLIFTKEFTVEVYNGTYLVAIYDLSHFWVCRLQLNDQQLSSHPFKSLSASIMALKQCTDYRSTISRLAMQGGHSSVNCCLAGAFLGCRDGFSALPESWVQGLLPKQRAWLNERVNSLLDKMGLP